MSRPRGFVAGVVAGCVLVVVEVEVVVVVVAVAVVAEEENGCSGC